MLRKVLGPALLAACAACSSKTLLTPIADEPACSDYEVGAAKVPMKGGLEHPVQLTVQRKGTIVAKVVVFGVRPGGTPTKVGLPDANADYTYEWGVCPNARATEPLGNENAKKDPYAVAYQCGDAKVHSSGTLSTKKGDPSTHVITYVGSPEATCLVSQLPAPPPPPPPRELPPAEPPPLVAPPPSASVSASASASHSAHAK